jgi:hypothetical protein
MTAMQVLRRVWPLYCKLSREVGIPRLRRDYMLDMIRTQLASPDARKLIQQARKCPWMGAEAFGILSGAMMGFGHRGEG